MNQARGCEGRKKNKFESRTIKLTYAYSIHILYMHTYIHYIYIYIKELYCIYSEARVERVNSAVEKRTKKKRTVDAQSSRTLTLS